MADKKRKIDQQFDLSTVGDGFTGENIFLEKSNCHAYTFDDVIVLPGHVSDNPEISLQTKVSRNITLNLPLLSSPMDTVTEHQMAIGMALQGALGTNVKY